MAWWKRNTKFFILCLFFSLVANAVHAEGLSLNTINITQHRDQVQISPLMQYTIDSSGELSLEKILAETSQTWQQENTAIPNLGFVDSPIWFRVGVENRGVDRIKRLLVLDNQLLSHVEVYIVDDLNKVVDSYKAGTHFSNTFQEYNSAMFLFPVEIRPYSRLRIFMKIDTQNSVQVPLWLTDESGLFALERERLYFNGIFYGILLIILIYNLFTFVSLREVTYLHYVLYVIGIAGFQLTLHGLAREHLWPSTSTFNESALIFFVLWSTVFASLFASSFFALHKTRPKLHKILMGYACIGAASVLLIPFASYSFLIKWVTVLAISSSFFTFGIGVYLASLKTRYATFFSLAWFHLSVGVTVLALNKFGLIDRNGFTENIHQFTTVIEVILLSLALAERLNRERQEKITAQQRNLEMEQSARQAQERLSANQEQEKANLENKVEERTAELRMALEELSNANRQSIQASRAKTQFLAAASHDLRQPLHATTLFVGALEKRITDPESLDIMDKIKASTEALSGLLTSLLDISKLDAGVVKAHKEHFALLPMLQGLEDEFAEQAKEHGLSISLRASEFTVFSDPVLLQRIIRNLLLNAVRHAGKGRILFAARRRGDVVRIEVWDSGKGIPDREQKDIFIEFHQLNNAERDREKGLGLGLAIVQRMATLLDCKIELRSNLGKGTVFLIEVPLGDEKKLVAAKKISSPVKSAIAGKVIVFIDDEAMIREAMVTLLRSWKCKPICAGDPQEAVDQLTQSGLTPDLLISDYRLTNNLTGVDALLYVEAHTIKKVPGIIITGDTAPETLKKVQSSGFKLLNKPLNPGKLRMIVNRTLSGD